MDEGSKEAKAVRQDGKPITFGLSYGAFPPKVASTIGCALEVAEGIFDAYHNEMYPTITEMREKVTKQAYKDGYLHLGLGCHISSSDIEKHIRTLFNALSQFWSVLTLIAANELHHRIDEQDLDSDILLNGTIYDALYGIVKDDADTIKWLNDTVVPIMTKDFLEDQILANDANLEIGTSWADTIELPHNASTEHINQTIKELNE